ncbi:MULTISPECIES: YceI family protein [unclassified Kribbella]|uniref:YceI family protein n=1 Tax=unclassified Kribbella TaxID=2644121 RepID=UPI0033EF6E60
MEWKIDPAHSSVDLSVRYLVSTIHGRFNGLRGPVQLGDGPDGEVPELVSFDANFDLDSFDSGVPTRDHHIKGEDFLDVGVHPEAKVRLASLTKDVLSTYLMTVELTLHGVTRAVDLVADTAGPVTDGFGIQRVGARATGRLRRSEFGISAFRGLISDIVEFTVNVQAVPTSVPDDKLPPAK